MVNFKMKRPARKLGIRKRFMALTANEKTTSQKLLSKLSNLVKIMSQRYLPLSLKQYLNLLLIYGTKVYINMVREPDVLLLPSPSLYRRIESFSDSECWHYFETRKEHLTGLMKGLEFPDWCELPNKSWLSGEEIFLRGMYELVTGCTQFQLSSVFGSDQSTKSRPKTCSKR